jgi:hypothetical protein
VTKDGKIPMTVAVEIVNVIQGFHYKKPPNEYQLVNHAEQLMHRIPMDIAQSVVLFLSGRAENIYPTEPGLFHPGQKPGEPMTYNAEVGLGHLPPGHDSIPELIIAQIDNFHVEHLPPGDFVQAVLENDLTSVLSFADEDSFKALRSIWAYCHKSLPPEAWGNPDLVASWLSLEGQGEDEDARER